MSLQRMIKTMNVVLFVFVVLIVGSLLWLNITYEGQKGATVRQMEFKQLGLDFERSSEYLTNEARHYVQFGDRVHYDNYWREVKETKTRDRVTQRLKELEAPEDELLLIEQAKQASDALVKTEEAAFAAVEEGNLEKARQLMFDGSYAGSQKQIMGFTAEFQKKMNARAEAQSQSLTELTGTIMMLIEVLLGMFLVLMTVLFYLLAKRVIGPLKLLTKTARRVADGDLTVEEIPVNGKHELAVLSGTINAMVGSLREVIGQVNRSTAYIHSSARELLANSEESRLSSGEVTRAMREMANGSEAQLRGAEESLRAMEEMAGGIGRIAETSSIVSEASSETTEAAVEGNRKIAGVSRQMNFISVSAGRVSDVVRLLDNRSQEIGEIVAVITGISAQTNLLALNAAIEAARAGEHGRGFAVVADEVRKLAEQSERSAAQIAELIQEIQENTARAVEAMGVSTQEVETGLQLVDAAGAAFQQILEATQHVADQVQEISAASEEMSAGSEEITASVEELTRIARHSSDSAQGVTASMQEQQKRIESMTDAVGQLSDIAGELQEVIRKFQV